MERASIRAPSGEQVPRRPIMLIEDGSGDLSYIDKTAILESGFDLVVCSGPASAGEECPLVMDGACPVGRPDVVVCDLKGEWRHPVEAAWSLAGVPVTSTAGGAEGHHVGTAWSALHRSTRAAAD